MGDNYQPNYGRNDSRSQHSYYDNRADHYERRDRDRDRDYSFRGPRQDQGNASNSGFTFRGAARDSDHYRPQDNFNRQNQRKPQEEFSFRAQGPSAPRFPETRGPPAGQNTRVQRRQGHGNGPSRGGRGGNRGRGGFRSRAAHTRAILSESGRERTPEQLAGMNDDGAVHFKEVLSDSEGSEDGEIDDEHDISDAPRKRARVEEPSEAEAARPKWSNPDPYTALPPPETLGAPKKDIVQVIRKAKVEAAPKHDSTNAVKENVDFISFNFDDDDDDSSSSISIDNQPPANAPTGPAGHVDRHYAHLDYDDEPTSAGHDQHRGPPSPPAGLVMPSVEELASQYGTKPQKKNKRKRGDRDDEVVGNVSKEWQSNGQNPTPWSINDHTEVENTGLRLHQEICDFFAFVKPHDYEEAVRRDLIYRIEKTIRSSRLMHAQSVELRCFGSFAAGLYLPTADMDLVAVTPNYMQGGAKMFCQSANQMYKLSAHLTQWDIPAPGTIAVVAKARVPIIKFTDKTTGIKVDISFENDSGIRANKTFQDWKASYPAMPTLVVLIKQLMAMRGLNEVFTGGIGGFSIICLVVSMMQLMPELQSGNMDGRIHYGDLLLNFLDLYGNKFDVNTTGIRFKPIPGYFNKLREPAPGQNDGRLTIIDPNKADNDISGGSRNIEKVFDVFRSAHGAIQKTLYRIQQGDDETESILACILAGNYSTFLRQREKLSLLHRGYAVSPPPPPAPTKNAKKNARKKAAMNTYHQRPLPPPPYPQARSAFPLPNKPVAQPQPASRNEVSPMTNEKIESMSKKQRLAYRRTKKADDWKKKRPAEAHLAPDQMTHGDARKMNGTTKKKKKKSDNNGATKPKKDKNKKKQKNKGP